MTAITRVRWSHAIERRLAMSQQNIEDVVRWLMTDEDLRTRFVLDRFETICEFQFRGASLTSDEIDLFLQSDSELWIGQHGAASRLH